MGFASGLRALVFAAFAAAAIATAAAPGAAAADPPAGASVAQRVVAIAEQQRGKRYVFEASGPSAFDCSGLVRFAYRKAGVIDRLGGGQSGSGMLAWARAHHRFSTSNPQVGDVVVYGRGSHVAIYIGRGRVISALNPRQGIRITALRALRNPVTGFIHTGLGQVRPAVAQVTPATAGPAASPATAEPAVAQATSATAGPADAQATPAASPATAAGSAPAPATVRTAVATVLRARPTTSSSALGVLRAGVELRLLGTSVQGGQPWDRVLYRDHVYWVRGDLVRAA